MTAVIARGVWAESGPTPWDARRVDGFVGAVGQVRIEQDETRIVALTGLGSRAEVSAGRIRQALAALARRVSGAADPTGADTIAIEVDLGSFACALEDGRLHAAIAEGLAYGGYRFRMTGADTFVSATVPIAAHGADGGWDRAVAVGAAVNRARDLVNLPGTALAPSRFAERARVMLEPLGVDVIVRDADELRRDGYGGVVSVGQGSAHPPCVLELRIGDGRPEYAFVGKGVTFDSGGLSLKSPEALIEMKSDMSGAAAIVGAFSLLPSIAPGRSFAAVIPLVENMPGPAATRPGDVVTLRNGATLEILDTDFEGRIILADGLARAAELTPRAIVDVASLTYAARHALGEGLAALVCSDDALAERILAAGEDSGDRAWRMPLQPELAHQIRSEIADYKNFPGAATARVSTAALLLSRFVGDIPWAHLDITGPCFRAVPDAFGAAGGTGYGVRLLAELVGRG